MSVKNKEKRYGSAKYKIVLNTLPVVRFFSIVNKASYEVFFNPASYIKPYNNCKVNASYA
mgnify:CR=1 FL=1